tara:strand:+ start:65 stop:478 length:414 start_codon:yes stop_codon:yes gene_type:complete
MAKIHGYSVQEALNASLGQMGQYIVLDASYKASGAGSAGASITAGSNADTTNTTHVNIKKGFTQILVYPEGDIYWKFSSTSALSTDDDVVANTDLKMVGGNLISLAVPRGQQANGEEMLFNFLSTSTTQHVVRIVGV